MSIVEQIQGRAKASPPTSIAVDKIVASPYQGRREFDADALESLAQNIRDFGLLNAILVRLKRGCYELIAGERRLRATRDYLRDTHINARIIECTDQEAADLCAAENFQRKDLKLSEKCRQVKCLRDQGRAIAAISRTLGLKVQEVNNLLEIAGLPETVQKMLEDNLIKATVVPVISHIQGEKNQTQAAQLAQQGKLTRNQLIGRTQHLPQKKSLSLSVTPSPAVVFSPLSAVVLNRRLLSMRSDLVQFDFSTLTSGQATALQIQIQDFMRTLQEITDRLANK